MYVMFPLGCDGDLLFGSDLLTRLAVIQVCTCVQRRADNRFFNG